MSEEDEDNSLEGIILPHSSDLEWSSDVDPR
jgi:hypothetical protein